MEVCDSPRTFAAGTGGVDDFSLVKLASGTVVKCTATATDEPIGVAEYATPEGGDVAVTLLGDVGTLEMVASGIIAVGDKVVADAGGKIKKLPTAAGSYLRVGTALQAAAGDGEVIEVLPYRFGETITVSS